MAESFAIEIKEPRKLRLFYIEKPNFGLAMSDLNTLIKTLANLPDDAQLSINGKTIKSSDKSLMRRLDFTNYWHARVYLPFKGGGCCFGKPNTTRSGTTNGQHVVVNHAPPPMSQSQQHNLGTHASTTAPSQSFNTYEPVYYNIGDTAKTASKVVITKTTKEMCIITWDKNPNTFRFKMTCGHAISKEGLTEYLRHLLETEDYTIRCPNHQECGGVWDYTLVRNLAELEPAELEKFDTTIAQNYLAAASGILQCPECETYCRRINLQDPAAICANCTREKGAQFIFCWNCQRPWIGTNYAKGCGNEGCTDEDRRLAVLRNCPPTKINSVVCPSVRACPRCGMLINHIDQCKHVTCTVDACKHPFCFICLKSKKNEKWICGTYRDPCTPAEIQENLPAGLES